VSERRAWTGLPAGETRARAAAALARLAAELVAGAPLFEPLRPGMPPMEAAFLSGLPGVALAHAVLAEAGLGDAHGARCAELVERGLAAVAGLGGEPGLARGLAGLGFVLAHLGVDDDEALGGIDARVGDAVTTLDHFDLLHGLTGLLVYARERGDDALARRVIEALLARAEGGAWRSAADPRFAGPELIARHPGGWFTPGVAHGVAAPVAALAACAWHPGAATAARQGMGWLWEARGGDARRWFGRVVGEPVDRSPGWCYGDEGIATALVAGAAALDDADWAARWRAIARDAAARPSDPAQGVSLCHGAAGLLVMHLRLAHATGEACFAAAAERAAEALVAALAAPWPGRKPWSLLTGLPGAALALVAATTALEPDWDRALLLS
jgi:hypothetical protein